MAISDAHNIIHTLFCDKNGTLVIIQFPNVSLSIWLVCTVANRFITQATASTALSILGGMALALWAVQEILDGATDFRRILGSTVLLYLVYKIVS